MDSRLFARCVEQLAPLPCAYEWDNSGFNLFLHDDIESVLVCLDVTNEAIEEAISKGCDTLLSHHPLLFNKLKKIDMLDPVSSLVIKATKANLNIYCAHTSYDCAPGGLNHKLAQMLGLGDINTLSPTENARYVKLVTFVPTSDCDTVCNAMFAAGAGHIGKYSHCAFKTPGVGSFLPHEGTNPTIGKIGEQEFVDEMRVEATLPAHFIGKALTMTKIAHPYEEPVVDLYELVDPNGSSGIGCIGDIKTLTADAFISTVKEKLGCDRLRANNFRGDISRVACVGGAGGDYFRVAKAKGAQAIVTGEAKYNHYAEAESMGILLIEAGHFETEILFVKEMSRYLQMRSDDIQCSLAVHESVSAMPYEYR